MAFSSTLESLGLHARNLPETKIIEQFVRFKPMLRLPKSWVLAGGADIVDIPGLAWCELITIVFVWTHMPLVLIQLLHANNFSCQIQRRWVIVVTRKLDLYVERQKKSLRSRCDLSVLLSLRLSSDKLPNQRRVRTKHAMPCVHENECLRRSAKPGSE